MLADETYRVPSDLSGSNAHPRRALGIGTCLINEPIKNVFPHGAAGCPVDHVLFNNASELPVELPHPIADYDFAMVQIPLPFVMPRRVFPSLPYNDIAAHEAFFDDCVGRLGMMFRLAMAYNERHGLTTIVWNFQEPQQNPAGRLLPKYDIRNLCYFIHKLNVELERLADEYRNVHILDFDQICANFGRRYFQDDMLYEATHLAAIGNGDYERDQARIHKHTSAEELFGPRLVEIYSAAWAEIVAIWKTNHNIDTVKMVVFDLDDTLWRGVVAELEAPDDQSALGWPSGIAETVLFLKKRGIITAIISKNNEDRVREIWHPVWRGFLELEDFPIRFINWTSKIENMQKVLTAANLLPKNVIFVDDNPVERAQMKEAFPDIRCIGEEPYLMRRILLWSSETQPAHITDESARRSEMIAAQVGRETTRAKMTPAEFLASANVQVEVFTVPSGGPEFVRAVELINKTNQFNTTGKRWAPEEVDALLREGGEIIAWKVRDKFADYGLVGAVVKRGNAIEQVVMSCRVFGLGVEQKFMPEVLSRFAGSIRALLKRTGVNHPCQNLFSDFSFQEGEEGDWHYNPPKDAQEGAGRPTVKGLHLWRWIGG